MTRKSSNLVTLLLALAGAILAGALTVQHFLPEELLPCNGGPGGCESVLRSAYSHLGPVPTAAFGLLMYAALVFLCIRRRQVLSLQPDAVPEPVLETDQSMDEGPEHDGIPDPDGILERAGLPDTSAERLETGVSLPETGVTLPDSDRQELRRFDRMIWLLALAGALISWGLQYVVLFVLKSFCPYCFTSAVLITAIALLASWDFILEGEPLTEMQRVAAAWAGIALLIAGFTVYTRSQQLRDLQHSDWLMRSDPRNQPESSDVSSVPRDRLLSSGSPVLGNPNAPFHLVEFGDYQCPLCGKVSSSVEALVLGSGGRVNLIFRNLPLKMHSWSEAAAMAAEAAGRQGKFWKMHDLLYLNQNEMDLPTFSPGRFIAWAQSIGMDPQRFQSDERDAVISVKVKQDKADADAVGVVATPTFYFVSPHSVWRFNLFKALDTAFANKNHPMWKQ